MGKSKKGKNSAPQIHFKKPTASLGIMGSNFGLSSDSPSNSGQLDFSADDSSSFQKDTPDLYKKPKSTSCEPVQVKDLNKLGIGKSCISRTCAIPKLEDLGAIFKKPQIGNSEDIEPASAEEYQEIWAGRKEGQSIHTNQNHLIKESARPKKDKFGCIDRIDQKIYQEDEEGNVKIIHIIKPKNRPTFNPKSSPYLRWCEREKEARHRVGLDFPEEDKRAHERYQEDKTRERDDYRSRRDSRNYNDSSRPGSSKDSYYSGSHRDRSPDRRRNRSPDRYRR